MSHCARDASRLGGVDAREQAGSALPLDVDRLCNGAIVVAAGLVAVGVVTSLAYTFADRSPDRLQRFLDVNAEGNLPTWFSVVLLAGCAAATCWIASLHASDGRTGVAAPWYALAALVTVMSLDDMTSLHEASGHLLRDRVEMPVLGKYAWIVPGAAAAALVAWVLVVAIRSMPPAEQQSLVAAGCLFIGAALGIELLEALLLNDDRNYLGRAWHVLPGAQELLEMVGAALFLRATLREVDRLASCGVAVGDPGRDRGHRGVKEWR